MIENIKRPFLQGLFPFAIFVKSAEADGVFCYTFFKAVAVKG